MAKTSRKVDGRPSWQMYPSDWLEDTGLRLCGLAAKGLWVEVLCHAFNAAERGILRSRAKQTLSKTLAKLVSEDVSTTEAALKQLIEFRVCESDGETYIYSRRMVRDEKQRRSKAEAGSRGGKVSRPPSRPRSKSEAKGGSTTPSSSPSPTPITLKDKDMAIRFDTFWTYWPKKVNKESARKAWAKISPDERLLETMISSILAFQKTEGWTKDSGRYIPHPATWLNNRRWEDEIPKTPEQTLREDIIAQNKRLDEFVQENQNAVG
tara:strand:+ start:273 stop:1067 length:795 start_codon:yes stop_codon:yes gene_type:complete